MRHRQLQRYRCQTTAAGLTGLLVALFGLPPPAAAQVFNPHRIFSDAELHDAASLSLTAIQKFLEQRGSVLATFQEEVEGQRLSAAKIIFKVARQTAISPKFLLATTEKEKGLLRKTASDTKQSDLDWATGYSCFSGRCNDKYRGFFNQIESTAITQNIYAERASSFPYQVGKPAKTREGFEIVPENQATANLYIYTPYVGHSPELGITNGLGGNRLFHSIWQRYFTEAKYPDGLVITDGVNFWKIENGRKRLFKTAAIYLADYQPGDAFTADAKTLAAYADGPDIIFPNHTIVRSAASGQALLLQDGAKRPIVTEAALAKLTDFHLALATFAEIPQVPAELLEPYALGTPITAEVTYPQGKLFSQPGTTTLWWVQDSVRHPVHPIVAQVNWKNRAPEPAQAAELGLFPVGSPIALHDGTFVRNADGSYYVITNAERRKITSAELFDRVFGAARREQAIVVPDDVLALHGTALMIDYIDDTIQDPLPAPTPLPIPTPTAPPYQIGAITVTPDTISGFTFQTVPVTVRVVNAGAAAWRGEEITLSVNNGSPLHFDETMVAPGQAATFSGPLTFGDMAGLQPQSFAIFGPDGSALSHFAKFAILKPGLAGQIIAETIPVAVKNYWRPTTVTVKIKNLSDQTWKSSKTALHLTAADGKTSPFYDAADWIRSNVPAVPINKKTIAPGEVGAFTFTLKAKGVKPGRYELRLGLELLDAKKTVLLDGQQTWVQKIRVDR